MKAKAIVMIFVVLLATLALAQTTAPTPAPAPGMPEHQMGMEHHRTPPPGGMPMDMGNLMRPPMELLGEWWKNPELANELREQGVSAIEFDRSVGGDDILNMLVVLSRPEDDFEAFEAVLDERPELVHERYRGASTTLLSAIAQPELGWDDARWAAEEVAYTRLWKEAYSVPH